MSVYRSVPKPRGKKNCNFDGTKWPTYCATSWPKFSAVQFAKKHMVPFRFFPITSGGKFLGLKTKLKLTTQIHGRISYQNSTRCILPRKLTYPLKNDGTGRWNFLFVNGSLLGDIRSFFGTLSASRNDDIIWVVPLPSNSDHQDYYMFSRGSL